MIRAQGRSQAGDGEEPEISDGRKTPLLLSLEGHGKSMSHDPRSRGIYLVGAGGTARDAAGSKERRKGSPLLPASLPSQLAISQACLDAAG